MNFTLDIVVVTDRILWGSLFENGSSTGATKMVMDGVVNATIGYYTSSVLKYQLMSLSHAYYTSSLVWMVPRGRELTSFSKIIKPFQLDLWISVTVVFIISLLGVVVINRCSINIRNYVMGKNVTSPSLNILNICFGGSLVKTPTRNFARFLVCMFMLYCIIIRTSYQGALFRFMKLDPREQIAGSVQEMMERNYLFYMRVTSIEHVNQFPDILKRTVFLTIEDATNYRFKLLDPNFKGTLLTSEDHTAYWNKLNMAKDFFHILKSRLTTFNLCIIFPKGSCLVPGVNEKILEFYANGFIKVMASQTIDKKYLIEPVVAPKTKRLEMKQLLGGFQLLAGDDGKLNLNDDNHICERQVPVLFVSDHGNQLRVYNKNWPGNYQVTFCDLERWNLRSNQLDSVGLTPEPHTSSSSADSSKSIVIVREKSDDGEKKPQKEFG
ncbi:unnamed protein product [Diamesa serratosioi]